MSSSTGRIGRSGWCENKQCTQGPGAGPTAGSGGSGDSPERRRSHSGGRLSSAPQLQRGLNHGLKFIPSISGERTNREKLEIGNEDPGNPTNQSVAFATESVRPGKYVTLQVSAEHSGVAVAQILLDLDRLQAA
jgi:hypothetical protein